MPLRAAGPVSVSGAIQVRPIDVGQRRVGTLQAATGLEHSGGRIRGLEIVATAQRSPGQATVAIGRRPDRGDPHPMPHCLLEDRRLRLHGDRMHLAIPLQRRQHLLVLGDPEHGADESMGAGQQPGAHGGQCCRRGGGEDRGHLPGSSLGHRRSLIPGVPHLMPAQPIDEADHRMPC